MIFCIIYSLLAATLVSSASYCGVTDNLSIQFCMYSSSSPVDPSQILVTLHSTSKGWAAFGVGEDMSQAFIVAGWKNSSGDYIVGDRIADGHHLPRFSNTQASKIVGLAHGPKPDWANTAFTISRPAISTDVSMSTASTFLYSFSDASVASPNDPASSFRQHKDYAQAIQLV